MLSMLGGLKFEANPGIGQKGAFLKDVGMWRDE